MDIRENAYYRTLAVSAVFFSLRLTPPLAAMVVLHVTLLKFMGSGPYWPLIYERVVSPCQTHWWSTLLYVQNYVNDKAMCIEQSWFLAIDMQLFILSPLVLLPLKKWPKTTLLVVLFVLFLNTVGIFFIGWNYEISGILGINIHSLNVRSYMKYYFNPTHTRAQAWLVGIFLGYALYYLKRSEQHVKNKVLASILWIGFLAVLGYSVFSGHDLIIEEYERWIHTFYITFLRLGWSIAVSWVILICSCGFGGPINVFLSLSIFQILSKLSYSLFIVHVSVIMLIKGNLRQAPYYSGLELWFDFAGFFTFSLFAATIWALFFESPVIALEKQICSDRAKSDSQRVFSKLARQYVSFFIESRKTYPKVEQM